MRTLFRTVPVLALLLTLVVSTYGRGGGRRVHGGRNADTMGAGDVAFSVPLETLAGDATFDLSASEGKPVVLIFGSYT